MKKILAVLLAALMLLSIVGCAGNPDPAPTSVPVENNPPASSSETEEPPVDESNPLYTKPTGEVNLQVWYAVSGVTGETFAAHVEQYAKENPNIHIEISYSGSYADTAEKIAANLLTGTAPDVVLTAAGPLYTGGRGDFTMETLIQDPEFDKDDIYEGVWKYAMFDGRICALPYGISVPVLYYNKTILEAAGIDIEKEAPKTWDDLYALAEKAQANGNVNNSEVFYGFETSDAPWLFKSMLNQNGNAIVDTSSGEIVPAYNDEAAVEVATFWQSLSTNGLMSVGEHANAEKTFLAGNCAFIVASSVRLARWSADPVVDFGVLPMPSFTKESVAMGGNVMITLAQDEEKLAASWDLMKYLTNTENHTDFSLKSGYIPIHKSAMETDVVKTAIVDDPRREVVYNSLNSAWSYWHFDAMGTMDWILGDVLATIEGGADIQSTLDKAVSDLEDEI